MSKVAIVKTSPRRVLHDVHRAMNAADYQRVIDRSVDTALKINISWHFFFPGCSTTPWQLDGVIRAMQRDGYDKKLMHACHNRTVVIDARLGERENKHIDVVRAHDLRNVHLYDPGEPWVHISDAVPALMDRFLVLPKVFGEEGFSIPKRFIGENIIHLPTCKTHVFTTTTGAMKNAFGGLLNERRHWAHTHIHATLVDLLMIQREIHRGVFAVMDGTFAGDGPGPRCMDPHTKNVMLASADQVAIDAVAAKLMGFDPMAIKYIRLAHEKGLGCGDPRDIEIVGDTEAAKDNWHFRGPSSGTFASRMQKRIYWGKLRRPIEWSLKTVLAPIAYLSSVVYHDSVWYPFVAQRRVADVMRSDWGKLFHNWGNVVADDDGFANVGAQHGELKRSGVRALAGSLPLIANALREAPELKRLRRNGGSSGLTLTRARHRTDPTARCRPWCSPTRHPRTRYPRRFVPIAHKARSA